MENWRRKKVQIILLVQEFIEKFVSENLNQRMQDLKRCFAVKSFEIDMKIVFFLQSNMCPDFDILNVNIFFKIKYSFHFLGCWFAKPMCEICFLCSFSKSDEGQISEDTKVRLREWRIP